MQYDYHAARRIMAGHLGNLYGGLIDLPTAGRHLTKLAAYAGECADVELEGMTLELVRQLEAGERPTLILPSLTLQVAPDPEHEVNLGPGDDAVLDEVMAEAMRAAAEAAPEPTLNPEQLTPTQIAEAGAPAPDPSKSDEGQS
ncbi:MAG: hypothetical protein AB7T31_16845 [Gemmatimonadales bacterium]